MQLLWLVLLGGFVGIVGLPCSCGLTMWDAWEDANSSPQDISEEIGHQLRFEARLMLLVALLPLVNLLSIEPTSCIEGPPLWLYVTYVPYLVRSRYVEFLMCQKLKIEWTRGNLVEFVAGGFEHMDWFTDSVFILQAYNCEPALTQIWIPAFEGSWVSTLIPIIHTLRFFGIAAGLFVLTASVQQSAPSFVKRVQTYNIGTPLFKRNCVAADIACFQVIAKHYEEKVRHLDPARTGYSAMVANDWECREGVQEFCADRTAITLVSKVFLENLCQLYLQSSFYAAMFDIMGTSARLKVLGCMILGLVFASKKLYSSWKECRLTIQGFVMNALVILTFLFVLILCLRVYKAHACPYHQWGLFQGCI